MITRLHPDHPSTKRVSRADIFSSEDSKGGIPEDSLVAHLEGLVQCSLGGLTSQTTKSRKKRRKIEKSSDDDTEFHESIPFRLVSTSLPPKLISLESKPPPPDNVATREPDYEDDTITAGRRMRQAQDVAVDYAWIIKESKKPSVPRPNSHKKLIQVRAASFDFGSPAPVIIRTREDQPSRMTRPPVPPSELLHPPYSPKGDKPFESIRSHCFTCLDVNTLAADYPNKHGKRRRRRGTRKGKIQPIFWRPNPAWGGKSAGYAIGYPSSWAAYEDDVGKYRRG